MYYLGLDLVFDAKLNLESGNQKVKYSRPAAILKLSLLQINRLLSTATNNIYKKFEVEIPKQT